MQGGMCKEKECDESCSSVSVGTGSWCCLCKHWLAPWWAIFLIVLTCYRCQSGKDLVVTVFGLKLCAYSSFLFLCLLEMFFRAVISLIFLLCRHWILSLLEFIIPVLVMRTVLKSAAHMNEQHLLQPQKSKADYKHRKEEKKTGPESILEHSKKRDRSSVRWKIGQGWR